MGVTSRLPYPTILPNSVASPTFNPPKKPNNHLRYGRNFKLFNNIEFQEELLKINWDENFLNNGTDDCTEFLVNKI